MIMSHTLGADWRDLFDLKITNALKPRFFKSESPFYALDPSNATKKGKMITNPEDIQSGMEILEGNARIVH